MSRIRSVLLRTENHIYTALTTICNPYGNVTIENMKQQVKAFYFQYDGLDEGQLDSIFTLAYRLSENKSWINDWEKTLGVYESDVAVAEGSIKAATSVPMEEIVQIVSRFIVSHSTTT